MSYEELPGPNPEETNSPAASAEYRPITGTEFCIVGGSVIGFLGGAAWISKTDTQTGTPAPKDQHTGFVTAAELTAPTVWGALTGYSLVLAARLAARGKRKLHKMHDNKKIIRSAAPEHLELEWQLFSIDQD